jgi:hypothetical protein
MVAGQPDDPANQAIRQEMTMTSITHMSALNTSMSASVPRFSSHFTMRRFAQLRASLPQMPDTGVSARVALGVAGRFALAAVPFAALGWLFFAV